MNKLFTILVASMFVATLASADNGCAPCEDSDLTAESAFLAIGDLLLVRPVAAAGTVAGFGLFAASSPFTAMGGVVEDSYNILVQKPGEFTFDRDLGDFSK
jgi:hypothetical protein